MDFLPKNDGAFQKEMEKLKELYLERKSQGGLSVEELSRLDEKAQQKMRKLSKMFQSKNGREKLKRECCRMEAKAAQLKLEGREREYALLMKKMEIQKGIFRNPGHCEKK